MEYHFEHLGAVKSKKYKVAKVPSWRPSPSDVPIEEKIERDVWGEDYDEVEAQ